MEWPEKLGTLGIAIMMCGVSIGLITVVVGFVARCYKGF